MKFPKTAHSNDEEAPLSQTALLDLVFASLPDLLVLKDRNFIYQAVNPAFCHFLAKDAADIIGKTDFDLFPEVEAERYRRDDVRVMASRIPQVRDEEVTGADGKRWLQVVKTPVLDERGQAVGILCTVRDICERKEMEEALRETTNTLQALIAAAPLAITSLDRDLRVQLWNPAAERIFGWSEAETLGGPAPIIPEDQWPEAMARIHRDLEGESQSALELRRLRRDGTMIDVSLWTAPLRNAKGEIIGDLGIFADISRRKEMEKALKASEANYRAIFNAMNDGIAVVDPETGNFLDVNQKWCEMSGFSPEEARRLNVAALCLDEPLHTPADAWRWIEAAAKGTPQFFEFQAKNKEGRRHWVEINLRHTVIGGQDRLLAVIRDISARKESEQALRASEARYRTLVEQIPAITYIAALDDVSTQIYISPPVETILGFTPEEWLADPELFKKQLHPEDRDRVLTGLLLSYAKEGSFSNEYRLLSKDGRVVWIRDESRAVYDSEGRPLFVQGVALNITERKQAEEALLEANNKLKALVQASPLAIVGFDLQGKVISSNPAAERIFGWGQNEVMDRLHHLMPEGQKEESWQLWQRILRGEPILGVEFRHRRKDGALVDVSLATAPLFDAAGNLTGSMGVFEDITARKRTAEALRESEARFRAMFERAPIGLALVDLERHVLEVNPALCDMAGYSAAELRRHNVVDFTQPDEGEAKFSRFAELAAGKRNQYQIEKRFRHKEGHWVWVRLSVSLVRDVSGRPQFAMSMVEDITARKQAQEAADEVRRQQEAILNNISDLVWLKDREGRLLVVNDQFGRTCGMTPREVAGKFDQDIWGPKLGEKLRADDLEVMATGKQKRLEESLTNPDGRAQWFETIKTPIFNERGTVIGTTGIARDITKRRQIEEVLRKVSRALKAVTECDQALLRATNEAELLSEVCRIIVEVGGYRMAWVGFGRQDADKSVQLMAQEGIDEGYLQNLKVSWADEERGRGPTGTAIRTGKPAIVRDTQTDPRFALWRKKALKRGYASILALPLGDTQPFGALTIYATEPNAFDEEEIELLVGLANDLAYGIKALRADAESRRAEEALRQSETKYRSLMNSASDAIVLADPQGTITEVNQRAVDLLGYSEAELLGLKFALIHPPQKRRKVREKYQEVLKSGSGRLHEGMVLRRDGLTVPVEITQIMVEYGDQRVVQTIFRDITERQQAEEALRDSEQKLRRLASQLLTIQEKERRRVSRELHDELGQALTVLKIHLVAIENKLRRDQRGLKASCEKLLSDVDAVIENVRRLSYDLSPSILEDLGLSSSLRYLVEEACRNHQMLYDMTLAEIDTLFSAETKINIYRIFQEALTNIGRHAEADHIEVEISKQSNQVTFHLRDNGNGFDLKEARSRTLNKRGLGLTTMHERALLAGGQLSIWSRKGQGTAITLTIPVQTQG